MARGKNAAKPLLGAEEFAGEDAEKEAIDKITAARKAATIEAEADAKKGGNGGPILDEDAWRRAANELVAEQIELDHLAEKVAEVRGRISSIKKVAEKCGADWDVIKVYAKFTKRIRIGEMGEIVTEQRRLASLMKLMDCPVHTQFGLFPEIITHESAADGAPPKPGMDAELQGQASFRNGEPRANNAFQAGTEEYVDWERGWLNAEAAFLNPRGEGDAAGAH